MTSLSLKRSERFNKPKGPVLFIIMDGVGIGKKDDSDAVFSAKTPNLDAYMQHYPTSLLKAHGIAVGLPSDDDMGNSEVGHNAMGAGRVVSQGAKLVNKAIASKQIFQTPLWEQIVTQCRSDNKAFHLMGLLSDGNVHSHISQLFSILEQAQKDGIQKIFVHPLLDGRDVPEKSALTYIQQLEEKLAELSQGSDYIYQIASGGGRMVTTMDRYFADWSIVERGWNAHVKGNARFFDSASQAIQTYYDEDPAITDQYLPAFVIAKQGQPIGPIQDGECVVFFNFRGDRAIEISMSFENESFTHFDRGKKPDVLYAGMMQYDGDLQIPKHYLVNPPQIAHPIGEYLCAANIRSFAIAETQKYGHVTYFWNGNNSGYINESLETYVEIPSDKLTFDKKPEMKAYEVTQAALKLLRSGDYEFGRINFANGDMVGHTGVFSAAIKAVESVDNCIGQLVSEVKALGGITVITADHGNADEMFVYKNNQKETKTAHSLNPVPFIIISPESITFDQIDNPGLSNIAATLCNLLGYDAPESYDKSLLSTF